MINETEQNPEVVEQEEQLDQAEESSEQKIAQENKNSAERNFAEMRKKNTELQRKNDEAMQIIRNIEAQRQQEPSEDNVSEIVLSGDDDDLVDVKTIKAVLANQKKLEKKIAENAKNSYHMTADVRLKTNYPDMETVASNENLEKLKNEDPDLYSSILSNPDRYSQWAAAYKAIKRYGIYQEDAFVEDKTRAISNSNKPRPLTSVSPSQSDSPLGRANAFANAPLTDEAKKRYWKEMQEAMKRS